MISNGINGEEELTVLSKATILHTYQFLMSRI